MKKTCPKVVGASSSACLLLALLANNATAATSLYFDVNGASAGAGIVNGGSYSWDSALWSTSSGLAIATGNWAATDFARFPGGVSGNAYTVTVNADESMAGLFNTVSGVTVNIPAAGVGTLDVTTTGGTVVAGGFNVQGFLGTGSSVVNITAPISGNGGVEPSNGGTLNLYGANTYLGGTVFVSSSTLVNFNNNSSFSSGPMGLQLASGSFAPLLNKAGTTVTLANNFINVNTGDGVNFAADPNSPVISTGTWSLGANNVLIRNNGNSTSPLTLSGQISGSGNIIFSGANGGKITVKGANINTGSITVGSVGDTAITLSLGAANTIATSSQVIMAGGKLDPAGFTHAMGSTTLGLAVNSTIDFTAGGSFSLANSSVVAWTGATTLNLLNTGPGSLQIGTDATGLTSTQLSQIEFNGTDLGDAVITSQGFILDALAVPEPSTLALGALGGLGLLWMAKRRKA